MWRDGLIRLIGWRAAVLHADPLTFDRWLWLRRHLRGGAIRTLDAGCGSGPFTFYAAALGNEAVGISFDERNNQVARSRAMMIHQPRATFITADLRDLDKLRGELGQFDQIICLETIEHILDDAGLVRNLAALLREGGRLLLTTPFKDHPGRLGDRLSETEDGGHVRHGYTLAELRKLLGGVGLEIAWEGYVGAVTTQLITHVHRRFCGFNWFVAWLVILPLRISRVLEPMISRLTAQPLYSVAVVAEKRRSNTIALERSSESVLKSNPSN
jgi:SAM-dependent methyltransferase